MRRACALAVLSVVAATAGTARAAPNPIEVIADGCRELRAAEVQRVLEIELGSVSGRWTGPDPMRVELACSGTKLTIVAVDPVTDKRLSRELTLGPGVADRDRTVALLVSQLFLTSWTELLLARSPEAPPLPVARPPPVIAHAAERMARAAIEPPAVRGTLAALVGPRVRDWSAPIVDLRASLRPGLLVGRQLHLFLELGYERGAVGRLGGTVSYSLASAAAGVGWRWASLGPIVVDVAASAGGAYVDMQGNPSGQGIGASASGAVADLAIATGPSVRIGAARLGLELSAGETLPRAVAHVARDTDVSVGGPWAGVGLVLGTADGLP
jgi:hypothetical protein